MNDKIIAAVHAIVNDLSDRSGLGDEWDQIDEDTQDEIISEWVSIIQESLNI